MHKQWLQEGQYCNIHFITECNGALGKCGINSALKISMQVDRSCTLCIYAALIHLMMLLNALSLDCDIG